MVGVFITQVNFYDDIRRDTHSDARPQQPFDLSETTNKSKIIWGFQIMKELEKYITDERTGLKYELVGDYYFLAGDDEPEEHRPIGIWGQRHLRYFRQCNTTSA